MLLRRSLFTVLGVLTLGLATTGCSSLTRPDPIPIAAEPTPAPQIRQLPAGLAGAQHQAQPAAPPAQGG